MRRCLSQDPCKTIVANKVQCTSMEMSIRFLKPAMQHGLGGGGGGRDVICAYLLCFNVDSLPKAVCRVWSLVS